MPELAIKPVGLVEEVMMVRVVFMKCLDVWNTLFKGVSNMLRKTILVVKGNVESIPG